MKITNKTISIDRLIEKIKKKSKLIKSEKSTAQAELEEMQNSLNYLLSQL